MNPSPQGDILVAFLSILFEGAPYILLGTLISGFVGVYLPAGMMERLLPESRGRAILLCGLLGAVFPVCECAVVPVIRRLVQKGLPVGCAITYMLAAPIINPIVAISTFSAFEGQDAMFVTLSRMLMAYLVAISVGALVSRLPHAKVLSQSVLAAMDRVHSGKPTDAKGGCDTHEVGDQEAHACGHHHDQEGQGHVAQLSEQRLIDAMRLSLRDFCDTSLYFILGVLITSVFNTQFDQAVLDPVAGNDFFAVPTMMVLAFILSLCSTSDAFIAATMHLFSQVAKLAFLVFGPMMDIKLVFMYLAVFNRRFVVSLVAGVFVLVIILCLAWSVATP
jgi:uncharacterized membrane protein YraQ (UPF0718 family)